MSVCLLKRSQVLLCTDTELSSQSPISGIAFISDKGRILQSPINLEMSDIAASCQILSSIDYSLGLRLSQLIEGVTFGDNFNEKASNQLVTMNLALPGTDELLLGSDEMGRFSPLSNAIDTTFDFFANGHERHSVSDCHFLLLLEQLRSIHKPSSTFETNSNQEKAIIILLDVIAVKDLLGLISKIKPRYVFCFYEDLADWILWLKDYKLVQLQKTLTALNTKLHAIETLSVESGVSQLISTKMLGCVGSALIVGSATKLNINLLKSLARDFTYSLRTTTGGPCVDELNMLTHTQLNLKLPGIKFIDSNKSSTPQSFVLIGSGPSLDQSLDTIQELKKESFIVSAGSSIGSLLAHGIEPDFHVHVERGGSGQLSKVYEDLLSGFGLSDFGEAVGVFPTSIEPGLLGLYQRRLFYSRAGQSPLAIWPELKQFVLACEGPECLSAAFAFTLSLSPLRLMMFGCDLGSASSTSKRSSFAVGQSDRNFNLQVSGNLSPSAWTNRAMLLQVSFMQASVSSCSSIPEILNFSDGISLPFAESRRIDNCDLASNSRCSRDDLLAEISRSAEKLSILIDSEKVSQLVYARALNWFADWLQLARKAPKLSSSEIRLKASQLLSPPVSPESTFSYKIFRGSLRDAFLLTSHVSEQFPPGLCEQTECWNAFSLIVRSFSIEFEALFLRLSAK